ncbi:HNH endonuclease [Xanthomonas phage Xop411]|uniref:p42.1 n=1 Tax=Xanthomonas phage Xop411 TaxID=2913975 RepID=A5H1L2_9CAUD|nr:HNH endonuclease [Xanthomonas phage Xop411]ABK00189.1 p42.1 [Xanthomonas phage Xop411]
MRVTDLTFEDVDKLLAYDTETGVLTWKVSRSNVKAGSVAGRPNSNGHLQVMVHSKHYLVHRLAWLLHTGSWPIQQLDHINRVRDDNRIENLRECSNAENSQNRGKQSNNTSGVTGVSWYKRSGKWQALIKLNGKHIHLGYFDTIEEAATARSAAKRKYHMFQPEDRK